MKGNRLLETGRINSGGMCNQLLSALASQLLTHNKARRIAVNIAKLPKLLRKVIAPNQHATTFRRRCSLAKSGRDNAASAPWWRPQRPKRKPGIIAWVSGRPEDLGRPHFSFGLLAWTPVEATPPAGVLHSPQWSWNSIGVAIFLRR